MEALQQLGISLTQVLQTLSPFLDGLMNFFTFRAHRNLSVAYPLHLLDNG
jgi:hypothetical protein